MALLLQGEISRIRALRARGFNREHIARRLGVSPNQIRWVMSREGIDRWDTERVLMVELYAEFPDLHPDALLRQTREVLEITPRRDGAGVLRVHQHEAQRIRAYITELFRRKDDWLTAEQAARQLGIRPVTLSAAVTRGFRWAAGIERCAVPSRGRWGYRYDPETVAAAALRKGGRKCP